MVKRAVPGFCATTSMAQGFRKAIEYIMEHPECQKEDPEFDQWCDSVIEALENAKATINR